MLPFGVTIPATVPQGAEIPEGVMNNPVHMTLKFLALQGAPYIYDISRVRVKPPRFISIS
jgi:hypothetical protein